MTKKEFIEFVDKLGKDYGSYTESELYEIGVAFRTLERTEKNWSWLVGYLGIEKTGEQYRKWVSKKFLKDDSEFNQQLAIIYTEKQKLRDVANDYRKTLRDEARLETIKELIKENINNLKEMPYIKAETIKSNSKKEAVLLFSDLHIGAYVDDFYNTYNIEVARKRVKALTEQVIELCKNNAVSVLNVCNLGDLIHGIIHISARLQQETDAVDQIIKASEIVANMLNELKKSKAKIVYRSVIDNHSRMSANYKDHIEKENLNRIIDWYLEERLKNNDIEFAKDNLDLEIGKIELLNGKKLIFTHGHNDNFKTSLQGYLGATKEYVDYICFGHYHSSKMETYQNAKVIINGSIVGTEQYAYSKRLFSDPEQTLLIFNGNTLSLNYINLKGE